MYTMQWVDILDLPHIQVNDVWKSSEKLIFEIECTHGSAQCPECGSECQSVHSVKMKDIKDLPMSERKCLIRLHHRRFFCPRCKRTFMERLSWLAPSERYTRRYADKIADLGKEIDLAGVARAFSEGYKTVERIMYYREKPVKLGPEKLPTRLGIDEFSYRKGKKDYGVIIASRKGIVDVLPSRKESVLRRYFSSISKEARENVQTVTMDMWATFINLVKEFFPNARIVIDRFHVQKQLNKAVDTVRKTVQRTLSKQESKELKGLRWVLLKNKDMLNQEERTLLKKAFGYSSKLHSAYLRKEEFREIFEKNTNKKKAAKQIQRWIEKAAALKHRSFTTFLKTLNNRKDYILNYFRRLESNGFMEGIINKVKLIKRAAYGMTNFCHLRNRILLSFT